MSAGQHGAELLGLYQPGTTVVHRAGVGTKLLILSASSLAVAVLRGPASGLFALGIAVVVAGVARLGLRAFLRALRPVVLVVVLLAAFQLWHGGWAVAVEVVADLLAVVLAAAVLTATTPVDTVLDFVARACRPLRRVGVDPDRVALAMALMLRAVPGLLQIAYETRDAAKARGLERNLRALLVPLALRTVARATATGEALAARGIGDD